MSRAFAKEYDDQWLGDVEPTVIALALYLTRENGGVWVIETKSFKGKSGHTVHEMSNGLCYRLDNDGRWQVELDY